MFLFERIYWQQFYVSRLFFACLLATFLTIYGDDFDRIFIGVHRVQLQLIDGFVAFAGGADSKVRFVDER